LINRMGPEGFVVRTEAEPTKKDALAIEPASLHCGDPNWTLLVFVPALTMPDQD